MRERERKTEREREGGGCITVYTKTSSKIPKNDPKGEGTKARVTGRYYTMEGGCFEGGGRD